MRLSTLRTCLGINNKPYRSRITPKNIISEYENLKKVYLVQTGLTLFYCDQAARNYLSSKYGTKRVEKALTCSAF